jgi:uncharacterized protein (DUF1697 family)
MALTTRYAAFLRGINVGRHHRVSNEELRGLFQAMGFDEVACFRASGNIVFAAGAQRPEALAAQIEESLASALGYDVCALVRTDEQVRAIASFEPFAEQPAGSPSGKLQVSLLAAAPSAPVRAEVLSLAGDEDLLRFGERELYWLPSGGTRDSTLDLNAIETLLGPTTRRTKSTIELVANRYFSG